MINTKQLRALIGWLGILLPWIVMVLSNIFGYQNPSLIPDSISATYYIESCITPFIIILGSASLLLMCYKGYNQVDNIICSIAGLFGLGICLFPCGLSDLIRVWTDLSDMYHVGTFQLPYPISGIIHSICAAGFFLLLAYNSLFQFTRSKGDMTDNKAKRNIIYRTCGIGMLISFLLIIPISIWNIWGGVWVIETVALTFFGISWLTKAEVYTWLFKD